MVDSEPIQDMENSLSLVSLLVKDYDEAISFYTKSVGFRLVSDRQLAVDKRWVVISPSLTSTRNIGDLRSSNASNGAGTGVLLVKVTSEDEMKYVGNQCGGRVWLFLKTNDFDTQYHHMKLNGVVFLEEPRYEAYGKVVVWEDLYGNKWDMIQEKQ